MKRTKFNDYEKKLVFPAYGKYTVHVVFTENMIRSRMARYNSAGAAGLSDTRAFVSTYGSGCHIFFQPMADAGVIAHEAYHAVRRILDWIEAKEIDEEIVAYALTYLVDEISMFQEKVWGVKSSSRKKATNGNKDSQRAVVSVQSVSAYAGGVITEAGKTGTPGSSAQADGCGDVGCRCKASSRV